MSSIYSAIAEMNASDNCLILIYKKYPFANFLALMKKTGTVSYEEPLLHNLKGIQIQRDSDWDKPGSPNAVGMGGYTLHQSELDGNNNISAEIIIGYENTVIKYLKETNNWDDGMILGRDDRWTKLLGAVDLCFP